MKTPSFQHWEQARAVAGRLLPERVEMLGHLEQLAWMPLPEPLRQEQRQLLRELQQLASLRLEQLQQRATQRGAYGEAEYRRTVQALLADVEAAQGSFLLRVHEAMGRVRRELTEEVERCDRASDIIATVKRWEQAMPAAVHRELVVEELRLQEDVHRLSDKYRVLLQASHLVQVEEAGSFDAGLLASVPTGVLTVLDYLLFDVISPLPTLCDVGVRFLISRAGWDRYMPEALVARAAKSNALDKLEAALQTMEQKLRQSIECKFAEMNERLQSAEAAGACAPPPGAAERAEQQELQAFLAVVTPWLREEV